MFGVVLRCCESTLITRGDQPPLWQLLKDLGQKVSAGDRQVPGARGLPQSRSGGRPRRPSPRLGPLLAPWGHTSPSPAGTAGSDLLRPSFCPSPFLVFKWWLVVHFTNYPRFVTFQKQYFKNQQVAFSILLIHTGCIKWLLKISWKVNGALLTSALPMEDILPHDSKYFLISKDLRQKADSFLQHWYPVTLHNKNVN